MVAASDNPLLTIGLPVFNGENFLTEALKSILGQTFQDFELVISDNASTDGTEAICRSYCERDARVRYIRHAENRGAGANFNDLPGLARGRYFKWAAHDDVLDPQFLEKCIAFLEGNPAATLCFSLVKAIDADGNTLKLVDRNLRNIGSSNPAKRFSDIAVEHHACFEVFGVIRTEALRRTDLHLPFRGSDRALLAELALLGPMGYLQEPLFHSRDHIERFTHQVLMEGESVLKWYDPHIETRAKQQQLALFRQYLRMIRGHVVDHRVRWQCYAVMLRCLLQGQNFRPLLGEILLTVSPRLYKVTRQAWHKIFGSNLKKQTESLLDRS